MRIAAIGAVLVVLISSSNANLVLKKRINGNIAPKSVVYSGNGLFFVQNMMYRHSITVFNRGYEVVATISDQVDASLLGSAKYVGVYRGAPVEAAFSHNGKYAWVTNYRMFGKGFKKPGNDTCGTVGGFDHSFVYRVDAEGFKIVRAIPVGSVPKYVATSPDNKWVLVANWCSGDVSIIDIEQEKEVKRIRLGRYPRGMVFDSSSMRAYVALLGLYDIAVIHLQDFSVSWLKNIGRSPRHLAIDHKNQYLFASLNGEGAFAKVNLSTGKLVRKVKTGDRPRSLALSTDGRYAYVVNYLSDTVTKVDCEEMKVVETVKTDHHPIGITYDPEMKQIWVACYSGSILVFQDK